MFYVFLTTFTLFCIILVNIINKLWGFMKYQILEDIIVQLNSNTTKLSSYDLTNDLSATDFIKKVIEFFSVTTKNLKAFCVELSNKDMQKYLSKHINLLINKGNENIKLAIEYASGTKQIDLPLNINLSYNQAKQQTAEYKNVYDDMLQDLKIETERKAKDIATTLLYDLKFDLINLQNQIEHYENKIVEVF